MQVLFFIGLLGIIFTTMMFINTSVTVTAMRKKLDQVENVETLLSDVEFAVNKGILKTFPDLYLLESTGDLANLKFVSALVKWNDDELLTDPWGTSYEVVSASERRTIYADTNGVAGGNNQVQAYVTAFAVISAGPDGVFGNGDPRAGGYPTVAYPTTFNAVRAYTPPNQNAEGADDIYITFTTYSAAVDMWNNIKEVHDKVKSVAVNYYTERLELFQPRIVNYYESLDPDEVFDSSGNYILDDDEWLTALSTQVGFPRMPSDLETIGVSSEIAKVPSGFLEMNMVRFGTSDSQARISYNNPGEGVVNNWRVVYGNDVAGARLSIQ